MKNPFKKLSRDSLDETIEQLETMEVGSNIKGSMRVLGATLLLFLTVSAGLGIYWSSEPDLFAYASAQRQAEKSSNLQRVTGTKTVEALSLLGETLLNKPGGYLSNDRLPPGIFLDNLLEVENNLPPG